MSRKQKTTIDRPPGTVGLAELASTKPDETRRFLEKNFKWNFESVQMPQGEYLSHRSTHGSGVGIRATRANEDPSSLNYILVSDLEEAERKIRDSGGEIVLPRTDVPGMGSFFWFRAPGGPTLACWQDARQARRRTR